MARVKKVETFFIKAVRAQTSGMVSFEYTQGGLKIRTSVKADHKAVVMYLRDRGVEFFTFDPNAGHSRSDFLSDLSSNFRRWIRYRTVSGLVGLLEI